MISSAFLVYHEGAIYRELREDWFFCADDMDKSDQIEEAEYLSKTSPSTAASDISCQCDRIMNVFFTLNVVNVGKHLVAVCKEGASMIELIADHLEAFVSSRRVGMARRLSKRP